MKSIFIPTLNHMQFSLRLYQYQYCISIGADITNIGISLMNSNKHVTTKLIKYGEFIMGEEKSYLEIFCVVQNRWYQSSLSSL